MKKTILAVAAASMVLSGCSNLKFAWSASYATDNLVADLERSQQPQAPATKVPTAEAVK